jgi:hypothetical protein
MHAIQQALLLVRPQHARHPVLIVRNVCHAAHHLRLERRRVAVRLDVLDAVLIERFDDGFADFCADRIMPDRAAPG